MIKQEEKNQEQILDESEMLKALSESEDEFDIDLMASACRLPRQGGGNWKTGCEFEEAICRT